MEEIKKEPTKPEAEKEPAPEMPEMPEVTEETNGTNIEMAWQAHNHNGINSAKLDFGSIEHGSLGGLSDDDHSQYHNDTRGDARYIKKDGSTSDISGDISLNSHKLTDVTDPTSAQDAATKNYVDNNTGSTIVLATLREAGVVASKNYFVRQVNYNSTSGDLYWAVAATTRPVQCHIAWATKPSGFSQHFTGKVVNGNGDAEYGIVQIGDYVYSNNETDPIARYDAKTFSNKAVWSFDQNATKGQMAYDGSTYVYIIDKGATTHCRRYTIDSANSQFDHDTSWVTSPNTYKVLPEGLEYGFWCDGTYLYGFDVTDKKIYKITISDLSVADSITIDTNFNTGHEKGSICGIVKIGSQWYCFYDIVHRIATDSYRPETLVGIPFSW